jgi:hypothetical protein
VTRTNEHVHGRVRQAACSAPSGWGCADIGISQLLEGGTQSLNNGTWQMTGYGAFDVSNFPATDEVH